MAKLATQPSVKNNWLSAGHNLYIIDLDTGESLGLQGLPKEIEYSPETDWAVIKVPGRNAPHYHFTGAEDSLVLEISWYSVDVSVQDVILRCKWLESMTKADAYSGRPHLARLQWGKLFSKSIWLVTSAPYKLSNFDAQQGYLPRHAVQTVTLKRYLEQNSDIKQIYDFQT